MSALNAQQLRYLKAMGVPVWVPNVSDMPEAATDEVAFPVTTQEPSPVPMVAVPNTPQLLDTSNAILNTSATLDWAALQQQVTVCERCALAKTRTQTVFGSGNTHAICMIIGEAPGADEDRSGLPFVGKAGQLLNNMLASIQLPRESIYIANILKCRPPNNRDPQAQEVAQCRGYLARQIALVQPRLIVVVGRIAAQNLLQTQLPLGRLRGELHHEPNTKIPVIVTYHPAFLLRQPNDKRKAWDDLNWINEILQREH